jgi:hypothetical protein
MFPLFCPEVQPRVDLLCLRNLSQGGQMPTEAEFEAAMRAIRSVRTKGAKVHEEVIYAYAHAAVVAAEITRNLEKRREEYAANEKRASEDKPQ